MAASGDEARRAAIKSYQSALLQIRKQEATIATLKAELKEQGRLFNKSEDDLKALQSIGQMIGEVLTHLGGDKYIVKASNGPRYVVGCREKVRARRPKVAPALPGRPLLTLPLPPAPPPSACAPSWTAPS